MIKIYFHFLKFLLFFYRTGDFVSEDWSDADISFFSSPLCSDLILEDLLNKGKFLNPGSKVLTLRLPPRIKKTNFTSEDDDKINFYINDNNNSNNNNNNNNNEFENNENDINHKNYEKYFNLEEIFWCKMSWGRTRVFLLVRNNLK